MPVSPAQLQRQRRHAQKGGFIGFPVFNPSPGLSIGGVDFSAFLVKYSPNLRSTISPFSGVFRCQLDGPAATMALVRVEQELTYNRDGVTYAGRIRSVIPEDQILASANRTLTIECQDFTTLLDRDICAFAVSAPQVNPNRAVIESDVQRLGWLLQSFGRQSVTLHHVLQNYATVPATDYTGMTLRKAVESVLAYSGASYYVDFAKDLHCYLDEKQYSPFTLSETPDDVSSVAYAGLNLPADSVDLRNAIYGIPKAATSPATADQAKITPSADPNFATFCPAVIASFKAVTGQQIAKVAVGAFLTGTNTAVNPLFAQATAAGNLLTATVNSDTGDATTGTAGWLKAVALRTSTGLAASIWYKPNCGAGEAAPTFTAPGGLGPMTAQLAEFSLADATPLDQVGSAVVSNGSVVVAAANIDASSGELIIISSAWGYAANVTTSFQETINNSIMSVHMGDDGATNQNHHASFAYGITRLVGAVSRWYTDDASIALYGRHETSFSDNTVTTQADLDAKGAAALAENSQPRQEGTFQCRRVGLAVGQRMTIQSSLYTIPVVVDPLGNYSGVIQSVEVSYSEDEPGALFHIDFLKPTMTLAVQLGQVVSSISQPAVPASLPVATLFRARASQSAAQSVANNAWTSMTNMATGNSDGYDPDGDFAANLYTVPVTGLYDIRIRVSFAGAGAAGTRIGARILKNASVVPLTEMSAPISAGVQTAGAAIGDVLVLTKGDTLALQGYQDSGGALNTDPSPAGGGGTNAGVFMTVKFEGTLG